MNYRRYLYSGYSSHFHRSGAEVSQLMSGVWTDLYRGRLPARRDIAIVDVGCGDGAWLCWLASQGFTGLHGVDPCANIVALGSAGVRATAADATDFLRERPNSFDVIHGKDVIEHLTKDEAVEFCLAARRALKPGGKLWLLTFNGQAPFANSARWGDFTHELSLTPTSAYQLLRATGFDRICVQGVHATSRTIGGRLRRASYALLEPCFRLLLLLRDGRDRGTEFSTCRPDLFVIAEKLEPSAATITATSAADLRSDTPAIQVSSAP